ncbi:GDSL Lipase/Acylhydrolase [Favolaschia claudopus]|uniref:GDSL Lipase/Acylhydrolase n=1 Tax=Favolaschia claudopus TaxID=2862362 RepID=A0AAW0AR57_9AGAR
MAATVQDAIILFGDSITQGGWTEDGFGARLANAYSRKLDVLNRGLAGYNTDWAIPVLKQCLAPRDGSELLPKVRLLVVWFGANDAVLETGSQHVPLPKFIENLKYMVNLVHSAESPYYSPTTKILLVTPPPVNTYQRAADLGSREPAMALDREFERTKGYAKGVKEAAAVSKVEVVDVWTAIWKKAGEKEQALSRYLSDGLHLNRDGYTCRLAETFEIVYVELVNAIREHHPELHFDRLQYVFPAYVERVGHNSD